MDGDESEETPHFSIAGLQQKSTYTSVKTTLNTILANKPEKQIIIDAINRRVLAATNIAALASHLLFFEVHQAIDDQNLAYFDYDPNRIISDCFYNVLENGGSLPARFNNLLVENGVERPMNRFFGNSMKYLINEHITNCENNIRLHYRSRLKKFFKIIRPRAVPKNVHDTITYMVSEKSKVQPDMALIDAIPYLRELNLPNFDRGFFNQILYGEKWFRSILIFTEIQKIVDEHNSKQTNTKCSDKKSKKKSKKTTEKGFIVLPISSWQRRHIRIDTDAYLRLLQELNLDPKVRTKLKGKRAQEKPFVQMNFETFNKNRTVYWLDDSGKQKTKAVKKGFFSNKVITNMERGGKMFSFQIHTDGISATVLFEYQKTKNCEKDPEKYTSELRQMISEKKFDRKIGIDPGYKIWIGAVTQYRDGREVNLKYTSGQFHRDTGFYKRKKKWDKLSEHFEKFAATDRNDRLLYATTPSPKSVNWLEFIIHRMKIFNRGIATYTDRRYARLNFDKYISTQKVMDNMTNRLVGNDTSLVCIGATDFHPSAPIKKYVRCPGVKKIRAFLKKKRNSHVLLIDEYNTSKVCAKCHSNFDREFHKMLEGRGIRYRICWNCRREGRDIEPARIIVTDKSRRQITKENRAVGGKMQPRTKKTRIVQNNQFDFLNGSNNHRQIFQMWNRDTSAARNILYKGKFFSIESLFQTLINRILLTGICAVTGAEICETLKRPPKEREEAIVPQQEQQNAANPQQEQQDVILPQPAQQRAVRASKRKRNE